MNTLKTVAKQIEEFGTWIRAEEYSNVSADVYRMDTVVNAIIYTDKRGHIQQVTFQYAMK